MPAHTNSSYLLDTSYPLGFGIHFLWVSSPSPLMPLLCDIIEGKFYNVELTTINAGTTENAFSIFHFIGLYHHFNRKAHWAVLGTCMTMVAFLGFRFKL